MAYRMIGALIAGMWALASSAGPAMAQSVGDCDIPANFATRACVYPEGKVVVEVTLADLTQDNFAGFHSSSLDLGTTEARIGLSRNIELQLSVEPYGHNRTREMAIGPTDTSTGFGGLSVGAKFAILSGHNSPLSIAVQPTLSWPTQGFEVGHGGVGGTIELPFSYDLGDTVSASITPNVAIAGNRFSNLPTSNSRHLTYGITGGFDIRIIKPLTTTIEYRFVRDDDPIFGRSEHLAGVSLAWQVDQRWQLSAGTAVGLTNRSPRLELTVGFARHFR